MSGPAAHLSSCPPPLLIWPCIPPASPPWTRPRLCITIKYRPSRVSHSSIPLYWQPHSFHLTQASSPTLRTWPSWDSQPIIPSSHWPRPSMPSFPHQSAEFPWYITVISFVHAHAGTHIFHSLILLSFYCTQLPEPQIWSNPALHLIYTCMWSRKEEKT